jgi:hypothetical protein
MYKHDTTRRVESEVFPGVSIILKKMTEGRRLELRAMLKEPNARVREIIREQSALEKVAVEDRDNPKWLELQEEFEEIMASKVNPTYVLWGVKAVEGLEAEGRALTVTDWKDWPSALFNEVLDLVKSESELNGVERKNSELRTISGEPAQLPPSPSTVKPVESTDGGAIEIVPSTIGIV